MRVRIGVIGIEKHHAEIYSTAVRNRGMLAAIAGICMPGFYRPPVCEMCGAGHGVIAAREISVCCIGARW